jgi:hypothetical protein
MRTTLALDDDIMAAAKHLAQREKQTLGQAVSALARLGLMRAQRSGGTVRNGIPLLPTQKGAAPVTLARVNQLRDELI